MRRAACFCLLATTTLLGVPGCKLTESIRTRPAPPGPATSPTQVPSFDGSFFPPADAGADASTLRDGETPDHLTGRDGGGGSPADSSAGGTSGAGGDASAGSGGDGSGGTPVNTFDAACGVTSGACESYCVALSIAPGCDPAVWLPAADAGLDPVYVDECRCRCEAELRRDCRDEFDELIACGGSPLMLTCTADDDFPIISGVCGSRRYAFTECLRIAQATPVVDASAE